MFSIVALSFLAMVGCGAGGLELGVHCDIGFAAAAVAAMVFISSVDAWECEECPVSAEES